MQKIIYQKKQGGRKNRKTEQQREKVGEIGIKRKEIFKKKKLKLYNLLIKINKNRKLYEAEEQWDQNFYLLLTYQAQIFYFFYIRFFDS